jgi:peptidoglycan/xylan/chitin deacetylase (PgdA/CDA1 family)
MAGARLTSGLRQRPPRYRWPEGHRCAAAFTFDVDAESAHVFRNPEKAERQLADMEERRFGPRTGVPRILRLLDTYGLRGTFYLPGYTIVHHLAAVTAIRDAGHELGAHGNIHETLDTLTEDQEIRVMDEQLDIWRAQLGLRPTGYRSPSWELNVGTPALLKRYGFAYDSSLMGDDIPYDLPTPHGPLVEIPVQWLLDDAPLYRHVYGSSNAIADPDRVIRMWAQEFDGMYHENGCFVLTMHPWISGRAGRLLGLEQLIRHIRSFPDVWIATVGEIAAWAASQREA